MTAILDRPASTRTRDPKELLNAVQPHIKHLTVNVLDSGMTVWDREVALLLRDHTMVRDMAERILGNAVMYTVGCMEHPEVHSVSASSSTSVFTSSSSTHPCGGLCATCTTRAATSTMPRSSSVAATGCACAPRTS